MKKVSKPGSKKVNTNQQVEDFLVTPLHSTKLFEKDEI